MADDKKAPEFILTSVLKFANRAEGQVYVRGSREDCLKMASMLSTIAVSGDEAPSESFLQVMKAEFPFDLVAGRRWVAHNPQEVDDVPQPPAS